MAYDSYLPGFARTIPLLLAAYDALPAADPRRAALAEPIAQLRGWDFRWSAESVPTTLAVSWGDTLWTGADSFIRTERLDAPTFIATRVRPDAMLVALATARDRLARDFGDWRVAWGRLNRFQRLDGTIRPHFDDARPSVAVPFTWAQWGSLASFAARRYPNTTRYYGTSGNSFVAVVEFAPAGPRAWAVSAGGESGDPRSPHFADQIERYAAGKLRPVYFEPADLAAHTERRYRPGE